MGRRHRGDHAAAHPAARAGAGAEPLCRQSGSAPVRGDAACLNRLSPSPSASQASRAAKSSARRSTRAQRTTRSASPRCCWVRAPPRPTRRPPADPREPHSAQPPPPRRFARRRRGRAPARDAGLRSRLRVGPRRPLLRAARREPCRRAANRLRRPRRSCCERAARRRRRSGQRRAAATSLSSTARASRSVDRRSEVGVCPGPYPRGVSLLIRYHVEQDRGRALSFGLALGPPSRPHLCGACTGIYEPFLFTNCRSGGEEPRFAFSLRSLGERWSLEAGGREKERNPGCQQVT